MTEQQERMAVEILTTVRSIQKCDNRDLIGVLLCITEEVFKSGKYYDIFIDSTITGRGEDKKILAIKIVREYNGLGLKEAKELVERAPTSILVNLEADVAFNAKRALEEIGLRPEMRRV